MYKLYHSTYLQAVIYIVIRSCVERIHVHVGVPVQQRQQNTARGPRWGTVTEETVVFTVMLLNPHAKETVYHLEMVERGGFRESC